MLIHRAISVHNQLVQATRIAQLLRNLLRTSKLPGSPVRKASWCSNAALWFAKTLADFEVNNIAALRPLFCYNSQPCFDVSACASARWFASCARVGALVENLALRQQLAVLKRRHPRPRLDLVDRLFWVAVRRFWSGWQHSLIAARGFVLYVHWNRCLTATVRMEFRHPCLVRPFAPM